MRFYFYKFIDDEGVEYLLAEMPSINDKLVIGAIVPGIDGNYYDNICIATYLDENVDKRVSAKEWLSYIKEDIKKGTVRIDERFPFDIEKVAIVCFSEVK